MSTKLSDQVKALEVENEKLTELFADLMAKIRANWLHGNIYARNKCQADAFEEFLNDKGLRFTAIKTGGPNA